jgi:prepilin-type N-terminal cleavage/methylation domain-containing protein
MANKNLKNNSGFTLVEMLVTVGVFAITVAVSSVVFLNVNNLQQQTANLASLQNEGRYILEKMAKEIRSRELDYVETNPDEFGLTSALVFKPDESMDVISIGFDSGSQLIRLYQNGQSGPINSDQVSVESAKFLVTPTLSLPEQQSRVTILLVLKNKNVQTRYQKTLTLQTTISSRVYR